MQQKVIITKYQSAVNDYLSDGWQIVSITAQRVATGVDHTAVLGEFCFVIQKEK